MEKNVIRINEEQLHSIIKESVKMVLEEMSDESVDKLGNGNPNFLQKMFNTKANRRYNFRKDLANNADYDKHIDNQVKQAMSRGKNGYEDWWQDDNNTLTNMRKTGKYKGVNTSDITKDYYAQQFNNRYSGAKNAQRQSDEYNRQQMNGQYKTEIENEIRRAFNQPYVDWKKVDELKKQLAKYSSMDYANNLVSGLQQGNNRQSAKNARDIEDAQYGMRRFGK
jgi:hypothetical protein